MPFLQNWLWFVNVLVVSVLPSSPPARFSLSDWSKSFIRISYILAGVWTVSRINESFSYSTLHDIKSMREWYYTLVHTHTNLDNITVVGSCLFFLSLFIHVWLKLFEIIVLLVLSFFFFFHSLDYYFIFCYAVATITAKCILYEEKREKKKVHVICAPQHWCEEGTAAPCLQSCIFIHLFLLHWHPCLCRSLLFLWCANACVCFNHFLCCCFICLHNKINMHRPINWNV